MNIDKIHLITFSPTRTSRKVGEAIVRGTGIENVVNTDLTYQSVGDMGVDRDTLTVIAVPVYGGHVAPLALKRLADIHSDGAPVVLVVLYGNRAYEKALVELDTFITARGFKVIAGSTFIGEHSYSNEKYPIAVGRPLAEDLEYAELFGKKIHAKVVSAVDMEHLYMVDVSKIQRPVQPFFSLLRFLHGVIKMRKSGVPSPRIPQVNAELCTHCGYCVKQCPNGAIVKGDECNTIAEQCIRCCACVKGCPQKARTYDSPFAALIFDCFKREKENRIII